jgi:hypothetical protein
VTVADDLDLVAVLAELEHPGSEPRDRLAAVDHVWEQEVDGADSVGAAGAQSG